MWVLSYWHARQRRWWTASNPYSTICTCDILSRPVLLLGLPLHRLLVSFIYQFTTNSSQFCVQYLYMIRQEYSTRTHNDHHTGSYLSGLIASCKDHLSLWSLIWIPKPKKRLLDDPGTLASWRTDLKNLFIAVAVFSRDLSQYQLCKRASCYSVEPIISFPPAFFHSQCLEAP